MKKSGPSVKKKKKTKSVVKKTINIKENKKTEKKSKKIDFFHFFRKNKSSKIEKKDSKFLGLLKFLRMRGKRIVFLMMLMMLFVISFYAYHRHTTYNSIQLITKDDMALEYGSTQYDIQDFIEKVDGKIVSIKNEVDTSMVGSQEVVVEVKKENIVKDIPLVISVVDTVAPVIEVKNDKITITRGNDCNLLDNITSVRDEIDGDIPYNGEAGEGSTFYYQFQYDADALGNVGEHEIKVLAKDKNGNSVEKSFILEVVAPKRSYSQPVYYNAPANANASDLVSIAYSYVGYPYVGGTNGPNTFDCSGFVQYVYSRVGIHVSRSATTQIYDGIGVPYEEIQPGDIISWGYSGGAVTHSALYVGDGQMIHAANPSMGVILSSVNFWLERSGTTILSVRRIQ